MLLICCWCVHSKQMSHGVYTLAYAIRHCLLTRTHECNLKFKNNHKTRTWNRSNAQNRVKTMSNLNNNANKRHSYERKSSRVTPKVREYLAEIANERELELERFMVLSSSSPASSVSVGAQSLRGNEVTMRSCSSSRSRSRCRSHSGTSGVGVTAATAAVAKRNPMTADEAQITNIPIVMVTATGPEEQPQEMPQKFNSVEDMRTPTKCTQTETPQRQTRKTQTPESALKSHKRLEWDPAADVGYRCERAVSTSNISTLERSVLEAATLQRNDGRSNHSESDLNRLKATAAPPLASSTFVNRSASSQAQVTPVPRTTPVASTNQSSRRGSCMTSAASSFDYQHHSRPSTAGTVSTAGSTSSKTSSRHTPQSAEELLRQMEEQRQEREYTAQLEQVLSRRRQMSREQNKENQQPKMNNSAMSIVSSSTSTSSSCAMGKNDVDLGIDLLCSLVNKRSLTNSQKKQLAKDIIKRLVGFELVSSRSSASSRQSHRREQAQQTDPNSQTDAQTKVQDMATNTSCRSSIILPRSPPEELRLTVPVPAPRTRRATPTESPRGEPSCSYSSSTSGASNELITQKSNLQAAKSTDTAAEQAAMQEWLNPLTQSEIEYEQKRQQRDNLSLERRTQIDWIDAEIRRLCALQNLLRCNVRGDFPADETQLTSPSHVQGQAKSGHAVPARGGHPAPPAPPVTPVSMPVKVAAVAEKGAATGVVAASSRAGSGGAGSSGGSGTASVAGGAAFGEGGVGETLAGAGGASAGTRRASSGAGGTLSGRAGDEATSVVAGANIAVVEGPGGSRTGGTSSGASSGTGGPGAAAGEASSGAQASSGSSSGAAPGTAAPPLPPPLPPLPPAAAARQLQQRSKMATPALSHSGSSESVCSFVQQRQRQFLAHYQNQQQQRREQQQQLLMLQQQQQLIHRQQQKRELPQQLHLHAACHMSHCHHHEQQQQQQQQHYVQMQYAQAVGNAYSCLDDGAVYYQVLNSQGATATVASATRATAAAAASAMATTVATAAAAAAGVTSNSCTGSNTSSSMLCLSSEMSIPMGGMLNACEATTTTTTTTTHQYDDVACQQLQLQLRQRRRQVKRVASLDVPQQQMLQIRPRGIAYVLQFVGNDNVGHVLHDCLTVQDYLQRARPQFCAQSKQRKAILNQMQLLRNARRRELDELIEGSSLETIDRRLQQLPPPVTSKVRIFSTKEMKAMTNKRCENLPEVLAAQHREREERRRRSNRLMRDVFNRRLQRRVRSGKLSLNHSRTVI